jgi:3-dehydroquinate synthase
LSFNQIQISWTKLPPNAEKNVHYIWNEDDFSIDSNSQPQSYANVFSALNRAFELGLVRSQAWDLSQLSCEKRIAATAAAKIFKRGVLIIGEISADRPVSMDSLIVNHSVITDCFSGVRKSDLVIVDESVNRSWWHQMPSQMVTRRFSEEDKTPKFAWELKHLIEQRCKANQKVIVVGGGVAGDLCGFAASLAGRNFEFVPTTLLSMVDSSVGGKTGVNFGQWGKNQIGLFSLPSKTHICSQWLESLSQMELKSGLAEFAKHALIAGDSKLWDLSKIIASRIEQQDSFASLLHDCLMSSIKVKADVVARDPFEIGERRVLNLGHTLGHALETRAAQIGKPMPHGVCVAIGMFHALKLSQAHLGFNSAPYRDELIAMRLIPSVAVLKSVWGDVAQLKSQKEMYACLLLQDKKNSTHGQLSFVLMSDFGKMYEARDHSWLLNIDFEQAWAEILKTWDELTDE